MFLGVGLIFGVLARFYWIFFRFILIGDFLRFLFGSSSTTPNVSALADSSDGDSCLNPFSFSSKATSKVPVPVPTLTFLPRAGLCIELALLSAMLYSV